MDRAGPEPVIQLFHVHKRFGSHATLRDINLTVRESEFVYITGPSGAGKTTLLRLLFVDDMVSEGQILVKGVNLQRIPPKRIPFLRRKIGVVFQDFRPIDHYMVYENVLYEITDRIARITLNRPEKLNALSHELLAEYADALTQAEEDREVRVVIVKGAGRAFSAGYDVGGSPRQGSYVPSTCNRC